MQVGKQLSWKICSRIQLCLGFLGCAVKAYDNFSQKLAWLPRTIFWKFWAKDLSAQFSKVEKRQNYDIKKCQVWICETFLCRISASGATDGRHIVGKTYLTYNSFPPCQEIDISCHKISQNGHFVSKFPSSVTGISCFGPMWPQNPSWPRSQLTSDSGPGLEFSWASTLLKSKAVDQTKTTRYIMTH